MAEKIGGWWGRETEIDVLVINQTEKVTLLGECKWSVNPIGTYILVKLKQKGEVFRKKHNVQKIQFALFARVGFTPALEEKAKAE